MEKNTEIERKNMATMQDQLKMQVYENIFYTRSPFRPLQTIGPPLTIQ